MTPRPALDLPTAPTAPRRRVLACPARRAHAATLAAVAIPLTAGSAALAVMADRAGSPVLAAVAVLPLVALAAHLAQQAYDRRRDRP